MTYEISLSATEDELRMLVDFCNDFGIDVIIKADGTGFILNNASEIQKALLQGFYFGITGKHLKLNSVDLGKCSNLVCNQPATQKFGDYPFCDRCMPDRK